MVSNRNRRIFNLSERRAIWLASSGKCAMCGRLLSATWEADHIIAFSLGGETILSNGQALCQQCNRRKGGRYMVRTVNQWMPRAWQIAALQRFEGRNKLDFFLYAAPSTGKTSWALDAVRSELGRVYNKVIVVAPINNLKEQWATSAFYDMGLNVQPEWEPSNGFSEDFPIYLLTYQKVASRGKHVSVSALLRNLCQTEKVGVILDEPHHLGENLAWCNGVRDAFTDAKLHLLLSGTPVRTDKKVIPFAVYDDDGFIVPDYSYNLGRAITDFVSRDVGFQTRNGKVDYYDDGEYVSVWLNSTDLDASGLSYATRIALNPKHECLPALLKLADNELTLKRGPEGFNPSAGGLVQCIDHEHAKACCKVLKQITGEDPVLVISDNPDDDKPKVLIKNFKNGNQRWLVAVQMVAEGVDIPRLCVGVYATNKITELCFRQFVGRFTRWEKLDGAEKMRRQEATIFIYEHRVLYDLALKVRGEIRSAIAEDCERIQRQQGERKQSDSGSTRVPVGAVLGDSGHLIHGDNVISAEDQLQAEQWLINHGYPITQQNLSLADTFIKEFKGSARTNGAQETSGAQNTNNGEPLYQKIDKLKKLEEDLKHKIVGRQIEIAGLSKTREVNRIYYGKLGGRLNEAIGVDKNHATLEHLLKRIEWLQKEWVQVSAKGGW